MSDGREEREEETLRREEEEQQDREDCLDRDVHDLWHQEVVDS